MPPLLVIVGPTAVGKTALSLRLAAEFGGEIVSADSRLLYRGLDIGTAKPAPAERSQVPHHLIDICSPDERLSLGAYQQLAYAAIEAIQARGRLPILVGGTGQYVRAVTQGWSVPRVPPRPRLRAALRTLGQEEAARWLSRLDPPAAGRIHPNNLRRVVRALEVILTTGRPMSELQRRRPPPYAILTLGLTAGRRTLHDRADARVDAMLAGGLLAEVCALKEAGFGADLPAMSGLGYRQLLAYLDGEFEYDAAVERIKYDTHRLIRQQATWFRPDDRSIRWLSVERADWQAAAIREVATWLSAWPGTWAAGTVSEAS
ncbi:MAG: tRNA (adenosine(37)-N6)-dimethylallyltransferase MiaA [Candidatus Promineifilaceae bacterium]